MSRPPPVHSASVVYAGSEQRLGTSAASRTYSTRTAASLRTVLWKAATRTSYLVPLVSSSIS